MYFSLFGWLFSVTKRSECSAFNYYCGRMYSVMLRAMIFSAILVCSPAIQAETIEQAMQAYNEICTRWDVAHPGSYAPSDIASRFEALEQTTDWPTIKVRCRYNVAKLAVENKDQNAARKNLMKVLDIYDTKCKNIDTPGAGASQEYAAFALLDLYELSDATTESKTLNRTRLAKEFSNSAPASYFIGNRNMSLKAGRIDYQTWIDEVRSFVSDAKQVKPRFLADISEGIETGQENYEGNFKETLALFSDIEIVAQNQAGLLETPEGKRFLLQKQRVEERFRASSEENKAHRTIDPLPKIN